jgi:hypothetical protein
MCAMNNDKLAHRPKLISILMINLIKILNKFGRRDYYVVIENDVDFCHRVLTQCGLERKYKIFIKTMSSSPSLKLETVCFFETLIST